MVRKLNETGNKTYKVKADNFDDCLNNYIEYR